MTKRIIRKSGFNLSLEIESDQFLDTPRSDQRNWVIKKILNEACEELEHADCCVPLMITGSMPENHGIDLKNEPVTEQFIMEDWQIPVMKRMAEQVCKPNRSVLEIGFGRGIAAEFVQSLSPCSHTIVECNPVICESCESWIKSKEGKNIKLIKGMWQDVLSELDTYDGILFHTYPVDDEDFINNVANASTFAEHFFSAAYKLLNDDGFVTYLTLEPDSIGRNHQRALFKHFNSIKLTRMQDLAIPEDSHDALWIPSLVLIQVGR